MAWLRWIKKIDEGVTMSPTSRDSFEYRDGERRLIVYAELMAGKDPQRVIYRSSIASWLPPHDAEPMTDDQKARVLRHVQRFFALNDQIAVVQ